MKQNNTIQIENLKITYYNIDFKQIIKLNFTTH